MEFVIREEENLERIRELLFALRREELKFDEDLIVSEESIEKMLRWMGRKLKGNDAFLFVAESGNEALGYIFGWVERRSKNYWKTSKYGYICDLFVKKGCRRKGIGRALLEKAEEWFREKGISKIFLEVYFNNPAKEFYRKFGYYPLDIKMEKNLRKG